MQREVSHIGKSVFESNKIPKHVNMGVESDT